MWGGCDASTRAVGLPCMQPCDDLPANLAQLLASAMPWRGTADGLTETTSGCPTGANARLANGEIVNHAWRRLLPPQGACSDDDRQRKEGQQPHPRRAASLVTALLLWKLQLRRRRKTSSD